MKIRDNNIIMRDGDTVDGRDVSVDGAKLDAATHESIPGTLVMRDGSGSADVNATMAERLTTGRTIEVNGFVSGTAFFDGTSDVTITTTYTGVHNHHDLYYTEEEVDTKLAALDAAKTDVGHAHHLLTTNEGIVFASYDGTANAQLNLDWAGSGGDYGTASSPARSDHGHLATHYTKTETDDAYLTTLEAAGDVLRTVDASGNVHDLVQAPWALRLGTALGEAGLSLMTQDVNNEANRVMRTDANGDVKVEGLHVTADAVPSANIVDVFVTDNTGFVKRADPAALRTQMSLDDVVYTSNITDVVRDSDITDVVRDSDITDVVRTADMATVVYDADITDVVRTADMATVVYDSDITDVVRTADMATVVYDSDITDVVRDSDVATVARTDDNNTWTKGNRGAVIPLTGSDPVADLNASNNFDLTLDQPATLGFMNLEPGQSGVIEIKQGAIQVHALVFGPEAVWASGVPGQVSASLDAKDILTYYVLTPTQVFCNMINDVK